MNGNESNQQLKSLGKYAIERKLGQGGMGTVYLAKNLGLKKTIALKVLPRDKARNPILVRRFQAEAQAAGQLEHPNIVAVYDSGEADGYLYIAMEYVDGIDMFEYLKRAKVVPVSRSIDIIKQVASALQHAFEQNIVHRDIKPSNLLLRRDGTVKITDLGLARSIDDTLETNITRAGTTVGTVDYMAPEQARNSKSADIRSDIYSLGCTWYQMLTGAAPFPDGSMTNKLHAHATKPVPDPRDINENIPEGVYAIIQRMTAKKPEDRYQTPAELLEDLNRSKLTKAAFSNEILSDLSDDEIDVSDNFPDDDSDDEIDDQRRSRKSTHGSSKDLDVSRSDLRRRKSSSKSEERDDDSDEIDPDESRRKRRAEAEETNPGKTTRPLKSRPKSSSTAHDDEDEELDDRSSSRQRQSQTSDPEKSSKTKSKSSEELKNGVKAALKPLPPKRRPANEEKEVREGISLETLKPILIIAGIAAVVVGLGWIMFRFSGQFDADTIAKSRKQEPAQAAAQPQPQQLIVQPETPPQVVNERPTVEFDITKQPIPPWASATPGDPKALPIYTVGHGPTTETHFSTIADAIRAINHRVDKKGGTIQLLGNGPYVLSNAETLTVPRLILMSISPEDQPLIVLNPSDAGTASGLSLSGGELDVRGVHFVVNRAAGSSPTSCISVNDGQLFLRNCSFTATGSDTITASAITLTSNQDSTGVASIEPRVLVDRVTIRGNGFTGLNLHRTMSDLVVQDSLFATGTAPCLDVTGSLNPGIADSNQAKPRRIIRFLRSTLSGRKQILQLAAENTSKPPTTEFLFQDSICSAEGSGNSTILVSASHWPAVIKPQLANVRWTSNSSLFLGFEQLVDLGTQYKVNGPDEWLRVWNKKLDPIQFQRIVWQESTAVDLSSTAIDIFDHNNLPYREVKTAKGGWPGCNIKGLKIPGVISESRLIAIGQRPKTILSATPAANHANVRKVDLTKEDLGVVLNKSDWPSGTVFEASGYGNRMMSPARVSNKSVRIVFQQIEGNSNALRITAKGTDAKSKSDFPALFTVENGVLELESIVIDALQSSRSGASPWLISAKDASICLKGCQLDGPLSADLEQHQGLIQWISRGGESAGVAAVQPALQIVDCLLMSTGTGVKADWNYGNIIIKNSILAVRGNAIDLQMGSSLSSQSPTVTLEHVTFSASKAAIRVEQSDSPTTSSPVQFYVDWCAVVPPLEFKQGEANASTIIESVGVPIDRQRIQWWGNSNGVAKEVQSWLRQPNTEPIRTIAGWNSIWGESSELRFLTANDGIRLEDHLPSKWTSIKAESFTLEPSSPGARWAEGGRPVGVDLYRLKESLASKSVAKDTKMSSSPKPVPAPKPAGKPSAGF